MSTKTKTKEGLLLELSSILLEPWIKSQIDTIAQIRTKLLGFTTDEEEEEITKQIKNKIQKEGITAWKYNGGRGAILAATGIGKSKMAIDAIREMIEIEYSGGHVLYDILIVVPTEKLRDEGWKAEFEKWDRYSTYKLYVKTICYASLDTLKGERYDLVVLDEGHNITTNNSQFFANNQVRDIMMLTATRPTDYTKVDILNRLKVKPVYEMSLDEAVKLGIVSPYNITVVTAPIDSVKQVYTKAKWDKKLYTENDILGMHNMMVYNNRNPKARLNRMQFVYKLKSKIGNAKELLDMLPKNERRLVFCSNKNQAIELSEYRYFSKPTLPSKEAGDIGKLKEHRHLLDNWQGTTSLNKFLLEEIDELSCVNALNEGHNLGLIDVAFIAQLNSKQLHFIQRIGRILRWSADHKGQIIILVARDTIDEEWARRATSNLDSNNIRWVTIEDVRSGKESLLVETIKLEINEPETADI